MASVAQEIRILFKGPGDRLFIAYKPTGWSVATPTDKGRTGSPLSAVIGAKLGFAEENIKFPSKLGYNQRGLVIGTTDDAMYDQLTRYLLEGQVTKTYKCIIPANNTHNVWMDGHFPIKQALKRFNYSSQGSKGTIKFDLHKCPNVLSLRSSHNGELSNPFYGSSRMKRQLISKGRGVYAESNECAKFKMDYTIVNFRDHLQTLSQECDVKVPKGIDYGKFRLLELTIRDHAVDRELLDILSSLGITPVGAPTKTHKLVNYMKGNVKEHYGMLMELCKIELPHPIYKNRSITVETCSELQMATTWFHRHHSGRISTS